MDSFLVSWPLYAIGVKKPTDHEPRMWEQTFVTDDGTKFMPLFTDSDLAERWIRDQEVVYGVAVDLQRPSELEIILRAFQSRDIAHVAFDPGARVVTYTIDEVNRVAAKTDPFAG